MRSQVDVRPATPQDCPDINEIYRLAVLTGTGSFEIEPPDNAEMARRFEAVVAGGFPYLVATGGAKVLGFAYANAFRARAAFRYTIEDSIYVAPGNQRDGVGRMLLGELIRQSRDCGFREMIAVIGDSANVASIALHRAFGFKDAGMLTAVGYKHGLWLDAALMQLSLHGEN